MKRKKRKDRTSSPKGLTPGIRMKGGVRFDPTADGFIAIVHTWDNVFCNGEPEEWCAPQVFQTEDAAMQYYKRSIRPTLEKMMSEIHASKESSKVVYRKLEQ